MFVSTDFGSNLLYAMSRKYEEFHICMDYMIKERFGDLNIAVILRKMERIYTKFIEKSLIN
jgi:hypothetical protein